MSLLHKWLSKVTEDQAGRVMLVVFALVLGILLTIDTAQSRIWTDEVVFYQLTKNLPSYSTSSSWVQNMDLNRYDVPTTDYWEKAYDTPVWPHPPLGPILAWPLVKLGMSIRGLKIVADLMLVAALVLVFKVIRRHLSLLRTMYCFFPTLALTAAINGAPFFYHDIFMVLFLALTIFLVDRHSKWAYVAAGALALTKVDAVLFLVPLAIYQKNWKLLLSGLTLGLFWLQTWLTTSNPVYLWTHWLMVGHLVTGIWSLNIIPYLGGQLLQSNYAVSIPIIACVLIKTRPMWLLTLAIVSLGLATYAFAHNHMTQMLLVIPIIIAALIISQQRKLIGATND